MHLWHMLDGSWGLQLKGQFLTASIFGKTLVSPRTTVVFPEPLGPRIKTPPIFGLIALIIIASFSLSKETMAENGYTILRCMRQPPIIL